MDYFKHTGNDTKIWEKGETTHTRHFIESVRSTGLGFLPSKLFRRAAHVSGREFNSNVYRKY